MLDDSMYYHILGVSVQSFTQSGGRADFLRPFIWSRVQTCRDQTEKATQEHVYHSL
jgi:hypothetical protein